jgi:hypothetical protein
MKRSLLTLGLSMALSVFAFGPPQGKPNGSERPARAHSRQLRRRLDRSKLLVDPGRYGPLWWCLEQNVASSRRPARVRRCREWAVQDPDGPSGDRHRFLWRRAEAGAPAVAATVADIEARRHATRPRRQPHRQSGCAMMARHRRQCTGHAARCLNRSVLRTASTESRFAMRCGLPPATAWATSGGSARILAPSATATSSPASRRERRLARSGLPART